VDSDGPPGIGVDNDLAEPKEKGLPTIFKYQGSGKEVYVCGKIVLSFIAKKWGRYLLNMFLIINHTNKSFNTTALLCFPKKHLTVGFEPGLSVCLNTE
jgi:hypothetical protein